MIKKEYIVGTYCPSCNHIFEDRDISGNDVKCPYCGFETTLRSPLQRKREKAVVKNQIEIFKMGIYISFGAYIVMLLPLYLYILFSDISLSDIWQEHYIGVVIYTIITVILLISLLGICFPFFFMRLIKKHNYDIDWIRAFYRKHPKLGKFFFKQNYWEDPIQKMDDI